MLSECGPFAFNPGQWNVLETAASQKQPAQTFCTECSYVCLEKMVENL